MNRLIRIYTVCLLVSEFSLYDITWSKYFLNFAGEHFVVYSLGTLRHNSSRAKKKPVCIDVLKLEIK